MVTITQLFKGTVVQHFYDIGKLSKSKYFVEQLSDLVRKFLLWKYGGTYLDLDFIVVKRLNDFIPNVACAVKKDLIVTDGFMSLDLEVGRKVSEKFV